MQRIKNGLKVFLITIFLIITVFYLQRYGIKPLQKVVINMGLWAPLGIALLRGISIILPALPSSVYSLLAGSLLGFKTGYLTIILADLTFCNIAFFMARIWGRIPVSRLVGKRAMERIDNFSQNQLEGNFFLITGLLMTGLFDFLSYAIGISQTNWKVFAPALLISVLISDSILVAVGAGITQGASVTLGFVLLAMFILAILTGILRRNNS
ncbi:VTT domain-containing protein [Synechococcus sp. M16CYN]|uniref:TVP38/TMEM64 family protein n=1 Tax=Synechococcus sp. M16CYN TaxID=3103139 RepID=UPI00334164CE